MITIEEPESALTVMTGLPSYGDTDFVAAVTTPERYQWDSPSIELDSEAKYRILVADCGLKFNILRLLNQRGCQVIALPANTPVSYTHLTLPPSDLV